MVPVRPRRLRAGARRRLLARVAPALLGPVVVLVTLGLSSLAGPAGATPVRYRPPVDAPVVDPFRPPPDPWSAGNRGLEYRTTPLTPVRAAAAGVVVFAGPVAGTLHVTVRHSDGLRTSYSFLASVAVAAGTTVQGGDVVGQSSEVLHFGVRRPDGVYVDPAALLRGDVRVHLVPGGDDGASATDGPGERTALGAVVGERWSPVQRLLGLAGAVGGGPGPSDGPLARRLRLWEHYGRELLPAVHLDRWARAVAEEVTHPAPCTPPDAPVDRSPGRRILVLVGGFGSSSSAASVDEVDAPGLGYAAGDVVRFSYRGGRVPHLAGGSPFADLPAHEYGPADAEGDLAAAGSALADLLSGVAARAPGVPIDVVAHSQGGVVARLALADAAARGVLPGAVATLVTLGSPHRGADVATALEAAQGSPGGAALVDALAERVAPGLDPASPAARDLSEVGPVAARLSTEPVPVGVRFTSVAARGDLVVPAGRTRPAAGSAGATTVVDLVGPSAHSRLPGAPATTREIALAVAGRPPTCRPVGARVLDAVVPDVIAWAEDGLGAEAALALAAPAP